MIFGYPLFVEGKEIDRNDRERNGMVELYMIYFMNHE